MDRTLPNVEVYASIAEAYAARTRDNPHNALCERPATLALLGDIAGRQVLEVGCGPGHYSAELVARGARLDAFDVNPAFVELTRVRLGADANVFQHDAAAAWGFAASAGYDLVLAALVLDYIEDWGAILGECHRALRPDGVVIASLVHPCAAAEASRSGDYFQREVIEGVWPSYGVTIRCFRRSLSDVFAAFAAGGFAIERLVEPRPVDECRTRYPEKYLGLVRRPGFLCLRARRA